MEMNIESLAPIIQEVVSSGSQFRLYPQGKSMYPTIVEKKDSVMLESPRDLKVGDAVFYRRENGQYVLHRIMKVRKDSYDMCGDNQVSIERKVPAESVIAKMTGIFKNDVYINTEDASYKKQIKALNRKKALPRLWCSFKQLIYPAYALVFKRK